MAASGKYIGPIASGRWN